MRIIVCYCGRLRRGRLLFFNIIILILIALAAPHPLSHLFSLSLSPVVQVRLLVDLDQHGQIHRIPSIPAKPAPHTASPPVTSLASFTSTTLPPATTHRQALIQPLHRPHPSLAFSNHCSHHISLDTVFLLPLSRPLFTLFPVPHSVSHPALTCSHPTIEWHHE